MVLIVTIADLKVHNPRHSHLFRTVTLTKNSHWGLVESLLKYAALSGGNMLAHTLTGFKNDKLDGFKLDLK